MLNEEDLAALRRFVRAAREQRQAIRAPQLVQLATDIKAAPAVTVDFTAAHDLDAPMIVVRLPSPSPAGHKLDGLTRRESEIAALVSEGLSNKQIATRMRIALATVKEHVHHVLAKTELPNRAALAVAYRYTAMLDR